MPPGPTPGSRRQSQRQRRERIRRRACWLGASTLALCVLGVGAWVGHLSWGDPGLPPPPSAPSLVEVERHVAPRRPANEVYPYSIVPGGVHGADEALMIAAADPLVARHYRDIDLAGMQLIVVDKPRAVHVSYRVGDRVYWTKRKVMLRPGELLLSDGVDAIRTRCGNCVSDVAREPVSEHEPAPEVFDSPVPTSGTSPADSGGIPSLEAYRILSATGSLPPALSTQGLTPEALVADGGWPGGPLGTPTGWFGGVPAGPGRSSGGPAPGNTASVPASVGGPGGAVPPPGVTPPTEISDPPVPGGGPSPPGGGLPSVPGLDPPPGGGTSPPGHGLPPVPGLDLPPGGGLPSVPGLDPPAGGGTPPPGNGLPPVPGFDLPPGGGLPPAPGLDPPPGGGLPPAPELDPPPGGGTAPTPVPEPGSLLLLGGGLAALAARRRRWRAPSA